MSGNFILNIGMRLTADQATVLQDAVDLFRQRERLIPNNVVKVDGVDKDDAFVGLCRFYIEHADMHDKTYLKHWERGAKK